MTSIMSGPSSSPLSGPYHDPVRQDVHIIKCVVVGDSGVGKTRLICARACGTEYSLQQLMQTHVPTVWAIDSYRKNRQVLENSWQLVNGVRVSLRLWDTFGYHDKDRRFAYGRADVVLICFSVVRPRSLRSVIQHWYPEVRRICPGTPIVLCGCQIDLRHMYLSDDFINMDKGPFFRKISEEDIMLPDKGREIAREIGAPYYETSVYMQHGIEDVFSNVLRAALTSKRDRHFWTGMLGNLKRIPKPACQAPFEPPRPDGPVIEIPPLNLHHDLETILNNQSFCDLIFVVQGVCIQAHKVCLVAASHIFEDLFKTFNFEYSESPPHSESPPPKLQRTSSGKNPLMTCINGNGQTIGSVTDTTTLIDNEVIDMTGRSTEYNGGLPRRELNHAAFISIQLQQCEDVFNPGQKVIQTVITCAENITPSAFQIILDYLYTGHLSSNYSQLCDVCVAAELMGLRDIVFMAKNILNNEEFLNKDYYERFWAVQRQRAKDLLIKKGLFADVLFKVDDGTVLAHKALLMARCDVMLGMFSYNFKESSAKVIPFPGTYKDTFVALQEYLYTGKCPYLGDIDCLELIELANRLCLPRLLALAEDFIIQQLTTADQDKMDVHEEVLHLLEPAQLHNASQLSSWCLWYISCNYTTIYRRHAKLLLSLKPENQVMLSKRRWPPAWVMKEQEYYEKALLDEERQKAAMRPYMRRSSGDDNVDRGCLGFCSRNRRKFSYDTTTPI